METAQAGQQADSGSVNKHQLRGEWVSNSGRQHTRHFVKAVNWGTSGAAMEECSDSWNKYWMGNVISYFTLNTVGFMYCVYCMYTCMYSKYSLLGFLLVKWSPIKTSNYKDVVRKESDRIMKTETLNHLHSGLSSLWSCLRKMMKKMMTIQQVRWSDRDEQPQLCVVIMWSVVCLTSCLRHSGHTSRTLLWVSIWHSNEGQGKFYWIQFTYICHHRPAENQYTSTTVYWKPGQSPENQYLPTTVCWKPVQSTVNWSIFTI